MSLMNIYFDEIVIHHALRSRDRFGNAVYEVPTYINIRRDGYDKVVMDSMGEQVLSTYKIYSIRPIVPRDILEFDNVKYQVLSSSAVKSLDGQIDHFVSFI